MLYFALAIELLIIAFLSYEVNRLWKTHANNKIVSFFLFPGSVTHVLSHALICLITGSTIRNLNIFHLGDNEVQYERPKIRILGNFLIVIAPIFGCGLILVFLASYLESAAIENRNIYDGTGWFDNVVNLTENIKLTLNTLWKEIKSYNIQHLIFISLSIIFTTSMAPKRNELKLLFLGLAIIATIPFLLEMIGISMKDYTLSRKFLNFLWQMITLSISVLSATLLITLIFTGFKRLLGLRFKSDKGKKNGLRNDFRNIDRKENRPLGVSKSDLR